jgi:hypothetical protein
MKPGEPMDHRPTAAREKLAALLVQLEADPTLGEVRLAAADLALEIALREGDPLTADVAESLLSDLPVDSDPRLVESMRDKAQLARSARRSIAQRHRAPRDPAPPSTPPRPQSGL